DRVRPGDHCVPWHQCAPSPSDAAFPDRGRRVSALTVANRGARTYDGHIDPSGDFPMQRAACLLLSFAFLASPATPQAAAKEKPKWPPSPHVAATDPLRPEEQIK